MHDCGFVMQQLIDHAFECDCAVFGGILGAGTMGLFVFFTEFFVPCLKKLFKRIRSKKKPDSQA